MASPVAASQNLESHFDGGLAQYIGYCILGLLVTVCTLGICYPWSFTMIYSWKIKHTIVEGQRLSFDGTAVQLFGNWIKWWFFCVITLGIYSFWLFIALEKWKAKHTHFAN
ncbi:YjgN family protein [Heyndrickxia coagulans]|uniref:YjgN family protein n=1 Tax=Heyndrickxia coagulans TaxID=1398 RepID=UPI002235D7CD|nr:YjgN family protein [Heyndrickxia coagulans]UZH06366.1 YjgN family protein [Heyndrickxia coagulans]UZH06422.1 YjgN family protein [Heyndrickxia coagulans]